MIGWSVWFPVCSAVDMYDDHVSPATAAQTLLCTAARKRKEVSPPSDHSLTPELLFTFTFQWSTPDFPRNAFRSDQNYLLEILEGRSFQGKDSEWNNLEYFIAGAVFCKSHIHIWFNCTFEWGKWVLSSPVHSCSHIFHVLLRSCPRWWSFAIRSSWIPTLTPAGRTGHFMWSVPWLNPC